MVQKRNYRADVLALHKRENDKDNNIYCLVAASARFNFGYYQVKAGTSGQIITRSFR